MNQRNVLGARAQCEVSGTPKINNTFFKTLLQFGGSEMTESSDDRKVEAGAAIRTGIHAH
jgi:hypothetical protein